MIATALQVHGFHRLRRGARTLRLRQFLVRQFEQRTARRWPCGVPELQAQVRAGEVSMSAGALLASLPAKEQRAAVTTRAEAVEFICTRQLARRNLSQLDRAAVALRLREAVEQQAKERMLAGEEN